MRIADVLLLLLKIALSLESQFSKFTLEEAENVKSIEYKVIEFIKCLFSRFYR